MKNKRFDWLLAAVLALLTPAAQAAVLNAKDFGAVGDGAKDDTAALQAAIDAAEGDGHQLYLPPGNYKITSALTVENGSRGFVMRGAGEFRTAITQHTAGQDGIRVNSSKDGVTFEDFLVSGKYGNRSGAGIRIVFNAAQLSQIFLHRVVSTDWQYAFFADKIDQSNILGSYLGSSSYGIYIQNNVNGLNILGSAINGCDTVGIYMETPRGVTVQGNDIGGQCKDAAIRLKGGQISVNILANSFEMYRRDNYAVRISPERVNGSVTIIGNNIIQEQGTEKDNVTPPVLLESTDTVTASVIFENNLVQYYHPTTAAVRMTGPLSHEKPITGRAAIGGYNTTNQWNTVQDRTGGSSYSAQLGPFPRARQDLPRKTQAETRYNITWFDRASVAGVNHPDDLQAVYSYYAPGGSVRFGRSSLLNDHIIRPLEAWRAAYPVTESSTPEQVRAALIALQNAVTNMPAYFGP